MKNPKFPTKIKNVYLLYNWGTLKDFFYYKHQAIDYAKKGVIEGEDWKEFYQIRKGNITIEFTDTPHIKR